MEKIDRIPSQRNDASKVAIAMIESDDSSKLIVRAFRWQDDWYDVREIGDWAVSKLDMGKTKLFDTVAEARAAAGISHIASPPGKKLATLYGESFKMSHCIDTDKMPKSDFFNRSKYPVGVVFEFVDDNSFHIFYYEDESPKGLASSMAKIEQAAKSMEQAADAINGSNHMAISAHRTEISKESIKELLDSVHVLGPEQLTIAKEEMDRAHFAQYKNNLRTCINRKLTDAKTADNQPSTYEAVTFCLRLSEPYIPDMYPTTDEHMKCFVEIMGEYDKSGWSVTWNLIQDIRRSISTQAIFRRIELTFSPKVNPSNT